MNKRIYTAVLSIMLALPAFGQVSFGVRVGGAYSALIQKVEGTNNAGARFGFSVALLSRTFRSREHAIRLTNATTIRFRFR